MSLNRIVLVGRLVRDPEPRTTTTGSTVVEFSIAVDKRIKPKEAGAPTADFFRVKAWNQTGEFIAKWGTKGRLVSVDGRMESRKYTDKEGQNREMWEVVADNISLLDRPRDDAGGGEPSGGGGGYARPTANVAPAADEYDPFADE
ncbi:MAG TPA: single-stranded DNA-binding protein [Fimbriimonas sp.]|nr:single-stranded DNA-binding protein [Fimbriimonas sp.]